MFDSIARRYDVLNRLLSLGLDGSWRRQAIKTLQPSPGQVILDLCAGTGDFGLAALREAARRGREGTSKAGNEPEQPNKKLRVIGLDTARRMISIGRQKAASRGFGSQFSFAVAQAEDLPLADATIDGAIIAFGIRNVSNRERALRELARAIKTGGRLVILEFGIPRNPLFRGLYFFYFRRVLPLLGGMISGNRAAYDYLPDSVRRFPRDSEFCDLCRGSGFGDVRAAPLSLGIVTLYECIRKEK
jgi:demethylmenaquinone methyltransferase/2-methoxy-6-polyprenyl-1,4-benzoquinol methylase